MEALPISKSRLFCCCPSEVALFYVFGIKIKHLFTWGGDHLLKEVLPLWKAQVLSIPPVRFDRDGMMRTGG